LYFWFQAWWHLVGPSIPRVEVRGAYYPKPISRGSNVPAAEIKALTRKAKAAADQNATSCLHRERSKREQTEKKVGHDNGMTFLTCRLKSEDPKTIWRREVADWKVDPVLSEGCTQKPRTMLCTLGTRCAFLRRTQVSIESVVFVDK